MLADKKSHRLRLWVISLAFFAAGAIGRVVLSREGNEAYSYPYAVELQFCAYGAALTALALWILLQAHGAQQWVGCGVWFLMAIASVVAVLSSIPK